MFMSERYQHFHHTNSLANCYDPFEQSCLGTQCRSSSDCPRGSRLSTGCSSLHICQRPYSTVMQSNCSMFSMIMMNFIMYKNRNLMVTLDMLKRKKKSIEYSD